MSVNVTPGSSVEAAPGSGRVAGTRHPATPLEWLIPLTYTRPPLTLNQRMHWSHRARVSRQIHEEVRLHANRLNIPTLDRPTVTLHYTPRDKRRRDADNIVPTSKACVDGLRLCGVLAEDTPDYVDHRMPVIETPVNGTPGALVLHVEVRVGEKDRADVLRCSACHISEYDARMYSTGSGAWLCWRDFEKAAPRGFSICRQCFYEKPVGLPCGEPCV